MGYRSEVAYSISFETEDDMKKFIATAMAMRPDAVQALAECHISTEHHEINFHAEDVKWYGEFEDVQSHMALLDLVDEMANNIRAGYLYMRIGEDSDDNEYKSGGRNELIPWDNVELIRRISVNMDVCPNYLEQDISIANIFGEQP